MGKNATNYDGDVSAVHEVTGQLLSVSLAPAKVTFLIEKYQSGVPNSLPAEHQHVLTLKLKRGVVAAAGGMPD